MPELKTTAEQIEHIRCSVALSTNSRPQILTRKEINDLLDDIETLTRERDAAREPMPTAVATALNHLFAATHLRVTAQQLQQLLHDIVQIAPGYDWNADPQFLTRRIGDAHIALRGLAALAAETEEQ